MVAAVPIEVPDFRAESVRKSYENDDWSPDPKRKKEGQPSSSILGDIQPSEATIAYATEVWAKQGYRELQSPVGAKGV